MIDDTLEFEDYDLDVTEEDITGMQRQAAVSDLMELKKSLDYRIDRVDIYKESVTLEQLKAYRTAVRKVIRVLE